MPTRGIEARGGFTGERLEAKGGGGSSISRGDRFYPKIPHKGAVWKATDAGCSGVFRVDVHHSELPWL